MSSCRDLVELGADEKTFFCIGWRVESVCQNVFLLFPQLFVCGHLRHSHSPDGTSFPYSTHTHTHSLTLYTAVGKATRHQLERCNDAHERSTSQRGEPESEHQL